MTNADVDVQFQLLILFITGLIVVLGFLVVSWFKTRRFTWRTDVPLMLVASAMLFITISLVLLK